jgi:hypothetical protein
MGREKRGRHDLLYLYSDISIESKTVYNEIGREKMKKYIDYIREKERERERER